MNRSRSLGVMGLVGGLLAVLLGASACGQVAQRESPWEPIPPGVSLTAPPTTTKSAPPTTPVAPSAGPGRDGKVDRGRHVSGDGYEGVVLDPDAWYKDKEADDWFTPTDDEIATLERGLKTSLAAVDTNGRGGRALRELADYRRQYTGMIQDGQRVIAIYAFCKAEEDVFTDQWEKSVLMVADGGDCFWNAKVDLATGTALRFSVNGSV